MRRFQFQLDPVIRLKQQLRRQSEIHLKQTKMQLEQAMALSHNLKERLTSTAEAMDHAIKNATSPGDYLIQRQFSQDLCHRLEAAKQRVHLAKQEYEVATAQHLRISKEVEALESLRRSKRQEHQKQIDRENQKRLDADVIRRWMIRPAKREKRCDDA